MPRPLIGRHLLAPVDRARKQPHLNPSPSHFLYWRARSPDWALVSELHRGTGPSEALTNEIGAQESQ
jgi:hypothetical protein